MSGHDHEHGHEEDPSVCIKVGIFFTIVLGVIIFLGLIN